MFLLDTVVLSELHKPQRQRNRNVVQWIGEVPSRDLFIRQRRIDPSFAESLGGWLDTVLRTYERRILPVDIAVARRWGRLSQRIGNKGLDLAVAATALEHGLTIAIRNVSDFGPMVVPVLDPFTSPSRRTP